MLLCAGESLEKAEHWVVSVEKQVVCVTNDCRTFVTGLTVLFAMYFVLNLKYQPEAEATLDFIQRWLHLVSYLVSLSLSHFKLTLKITGMNNRTTKK